MVWSRTLSTYRCVVDRCAECGFEYDLDATEGGSAASIVDGVAWLSGVLVVPAGDLTTRRQPEVWSPLEYCCHVRDVLLVQRERVLAARRVDTPTFETMGRDERVVHDGYAAQDRLDVARQLTEAARLFANVLDRLGPGDWERTVIYNYPARVERSLRWVAAHTAHEVYHHAADVRRQLPAHGG